MPNAVVILGAGSSADFGVPTLNGVFKDPWAQNYLGQAGNPLLRMLRDTFWYPRGHDIHTSERSLTIEEMLTALRDWEAEPQLPESKRPVETELFRRQLYVLIYKAVFEGKSSSGEHLNPLIQICRNTFDRTTWASFNWDCMFESSFYYSSGGPGPYERANPFVHVQLDNWYQGHPRHELLKLHGSISWWLVNGRLRYHRWGAGGELERKWSEFDAGVAMPDIPVILEPSFYKYGDRPFRLLEEQWRIFFQRLLEADCVIVVGYSLPEGDHLARSKLLASFHANERARWLLIDPSADPCARYARLFGDRRLTIKGTSLAGFNNAILAHLQEAFPDIQFRDRPPARPAPPPAPAAR